MTYTVYTLKTPLPVRTSATTFLARQRQYLISYYASSLPDAVRLALNTKKTTRVTCP